MEAWLQHLLTQLALPEYGLSTVFVVSFISATLLPMGSEPAVFGLVKLNPDLFWPAVAVATVGNTLGGAVSWWMGWGAHEVVDKYRHSATHVQGAGLAGDASAPRPACWPGCPRSATRCARWPAGCKLPFWPCVAYMAVGKLARYVIMTASLLWVFPGQLPMIG